MIEDMDLFDIEEVIQLLDRRFINTFIVAIMKFIYKNFSFWKANLKKNWSILEKNYHTLAPVKCEFLY
jgi:hypothetical protein